jgi:hypothetical protein
MNITVLTDRYMLQTGYVIGTQAYWPDGHMLVSTSVQFSETSDELEHEEPELEDTQFGLPPG